MDLISAVICYKESKTPYQGALEIGKKKKRPTRQVMRPISAVLNSIQNINATVDLYVAFWRTQC